MKIIWVTIYTLFEQYLSKRVDSKKTRTVGPLGETADVFRYLTCIHVTWTIAFSFAYTNSHSHFRLSFLQWRKLLNKNEHNFSYTFWRLDIHHFLSTQCSTLISRASKKYVFQTKITVKCRISKPLVPEKLELFYNILIYIIKSK